MKICILAEYLTYIGGGERVYCCWANLFAERLGYEVTVVTLEKGTKTFYELSSQVKIQSLSLRPSRYYRSPLKRKLWMVTHLLSDRKKIQAFLVQNEFDVVLGIGTNISLLLALVKCKAIRIGTEHTEYFGAAFYLRGIRKKLYPKLDYITVLTAADEKKFSLFMPRICVMPNPLTISVTRHEPSETKRIVSIGSLSPQKNQSVMLDIMKKIHCRYPGWRLEIYGEGPLRDKLQKKISKLGLDDYVFLRGITTDVKKVLSTASFFILTSEIEGFGLVLIEAMACGLPCVSFDNSGPADIIQEGANGFLVPRGNVDLYAERISYLIENVNERRKMGKWAQQSIEKYTLINVSHVWQSFLERIIN